MQSNKLKSPVMGKTLLEHGHDVVRELYKLGLLDDKAKAEFEALEFKFKQKK